MVDGVEPADRASDSFQFHVFDYVYHQILRKESDWVARDLFRASFARTRNRPGSTRMTNVASLAFCYARLRR